MKNIYQVTIHGRTLESCDLRSLLSRAVLEKRSMDNRIRLFLSRPVSPLIGFSHISGVQARDAVGCC